MAAKSTRPRTQPGDPSAAGWVTFVARPSGIAGCAWSRPSRIHSTPNPMRRTCRPRGSAASSAAAGRNEVAGPGTHSRTLTQIMARRKKMRSAMIPWWMSADRKAATTVGLFSWRVEPIPDMTRAPSFTPVLALPATPGPRGVTQPPSRRSYADAILRRRLSRRSRYRSVQIRPRPAPGPGAAAGRHGPRRRGAASLLPVLPRDLCLPCRYPFITSCDRIRQSIGISASAAYGSPGPPPAQWGGPGCSE